MLVVLSICSSCGPVGMHGFFVAPRDLVCPRIFKVRGKPVRCIGEGLTFGLAEGLGAINREEAANPS